MEEQMTNEVVEVTEPEVEDRTYTISAGKIAAAGLIVGGAIVLTKKVIIPGCKKAGKWIKSKFTKKESENDDVIESEDYEEVDK